MLPSGYQEIEYVIADGTSYIDTGIVSSNLLKIEAFLDYISIGSQSQVGGLFGARNTNSNTSAGQILVAQASNGIYFGYNNNRALINLPTETGKTSLLVHIEGNTCTVNYGNMVMSSAERTSATFTGTRNMWIGAVNNAGRPMAIYHYVHYFRMWEWVEGTGYVLIRDYVSCIRESDNIVGMYDLVSNEFFVPVGTFQAPPYTITATSETGGEFIGKTGKFRHTTLYASPSEGYVFDAWYLNDTLYSYDNPLNVTGSANLVAKYKKKTNLSLDTGCYLYIKDRYQMLSGINCAIKVFTAEIDEDLMQRKISKINTEKVPDAVMIGDIAVLLSPMGKRIYQGIVSEIEENSISCREMNAYFDTPFLMHANTNVRMDTAYMYGITNISELTVQYGLYCYLFNTAYQSTEKPKTEHSGSGTGAEMFLQIGVRLPDLYFGDFTNANFPIIESNQVVNLEDYLFEMYNTFGIYLLFDVPLQRNVSSIENGTAKVFYPNYEELKFGNNEENITNVKVVVDNAETNLIYVYSSDGNTFRGEFRSNSNVSDQNEKRSVACKEKLILSDDKISTIKAQNLTNDYNHRITCDVSTESNLYGFDDLILGRKVSFYNNGKLYESVISAKKYNIDEAGQIKSVSLTLGKARTNLTSKLNLGKVK